MADAAGSGAAPAPAELAGALRAAAASRRAQAAAPGVPEAALNDSCRETNPSSCQDCPPRRLRIVNARHGLTNRQNACRSAEAEALFASARTALVLVYAVIWLKPARQQF